MDCTTKGIRSIEPMAVDTNVPIIAKTPEANTSIIPKIDVEYQENLKNLDKFDSDMAKLLNGSDDKHDDDQLSLGQKRKLATEDIEQKRRMVTVRGLSGLSNIGNTCYMNSILQCLSNSKILTAYLAKKEFLYDLEYNLKHKLAKEQRKQIGAKDNESVHISTRELNNSVEESFTMNLYRVLSSMWEKNRTIEPRSFKRKIGQIMPIFAGHAQNDSHELLNMVLDTIHEELATNVSLEFRNVNKSVREYISVKNTCFEIINGDHTEEQKNKAKEAFLEYNKAHQKEEIIFESYIFWKNTTEKKYSAITDLFTGVYYSSIKCHECNNVSYKFELFTTLSVSIPENDTTLEQCLKMFSDGELMCSDNKYNCEICNKKVNATRNIYIWEVPEMLIIHLKRFRHFGSIETKIDSNITFPKTGLTLKDNESAYKKVDQHVFDLYAVSKHSGNVGFGHYTATCMNPLNKKWYRFDDSHVLHIPDENIDKEIMNNTAYILFYQKRYKFDDDE